MGSLVRTTVMAVTTSSAQLVLTNKKVPPGFGITKKNRYLCTVTKGRTVHRPNQGCECFILKIIQL
jgi:hypothetical protein